MPALKLSIRHVQKLLFATFLTMVLSACGLEKMTEHQNDNTNALQEVDRSSWVSLAGKKIFFAHQSVGQNILDGVDDLAGCQSYVRINVTEVPESGSAEEFVIVHAKIGKNFDPLSKIKAFVDIVEGGVGESVDIAALKFCYVDIRGPIGIDELLTEYELALDRLHKKYPDLIFLHFTMPLTSLDMSSIVKIKRIFGIDKREYQNNILRNEFNKRLLSRYKGKEPVLDIAEIESVRPNGSISSFNHKGNNYLTLADEYTYDGGHLNESGRQTVAEALLTLLASI